MTGFKKYLFIISSIIVGLIFIFSGFVKAIDPLGSNYKFIDYFEAFHMAWLEPTAFPLAIILSSLEFLIGVCLLLFIQTRLASFGALIFMSIFTPLTLWLALTNPISDCGCFGDAIILTNWQTFYKNIFILFFVLIVFIQRKKFNAWLTKRNEWIMTGIIAISIVGFSWYNYQHLPIIDFMPYKVGTFIPEKMQRPKDAPVDVYEQFFTLRNEKTGEEIKIESKQYTKDSTYWGQGSPWKFISSSEPVLVKKGYQTPIHDFNIKSLDDNDITQNVLNDNAYYFILVTYDLTKTNLKRQADINILAEMAKAAGHKFICLTGNSNDIIKEFKQKHNIKYDFYITDPITLKTVIRANPGLLLLHKGTILAKWHYNDIPDYNDIKKKYIK
jgi:uncharacterized membrane protein YphA (DoxX/SURF4 family)